MKRGQIGWLHQLDDRPRDDRLFREIVDSVFIAFYTFPSEHQHFAFVTNKLNLDDLSRLLDIKTLNKQASKMGALSRKPDAI